MTKKTTQTGRELSELLNPGMEDALNARYGHLLPGTPNASYAVVEAQRTGWSVSFRSVPYASDKASELEAKNGRTDWARFLASGWFAD